MSLEFTKFFMFIGISFLLFSKFFSQMKKKIKKFFIQSIFISTLIISILIVLIKFFIPQEYLFIEPISIYSTILSSVIFIYWFILTPAIWEFKESERLLVDIKITLTNIKEDAIYLKWLRNDYDLEGFYEIFSDWINNFYYSIVDNTDNNYINIFEKINQINLDWEKLWITANHIIRIKQELSILKKNFLRVTEIKNKDSLPKIIHNLKDFITLVVIITLLFLNLSTNSSDIFSQIQKWIMLFIISFLYIYLSFIINVFDNPFDKRRFNWFLDLRFLKDFYEDLNENK